MKQDRGGILFIFWGPHSRATEDAARRLGATLYAIHYFAASWRTASLITPLKYLLQCFKTWAVLIQQRPSAVYVIIPPTFSALSVYLYCLVARIPFVMDVHGHSLTSKKWAWTIPLQKFLARRALTTVVDQQKYQQTFEAWGAHTVVLERAPVDVPLSRLKRIDHSNTFSVVVVSIFAEDEPIDVVIAAAKQLPEVQFYITGDTKRADSHLLESAPDNVTFTGYLGGDDYWHRLYSSNAIMTLTTEPYSLVSGGIESMALGKATIVSRQPVLTDYFTKGTVFVEHSVQSIVDGVCTAQLHEARLSQELAELAVEKRTRWQREHEKLLQLMSQNSRVAVVPVARNKEV